MIPEIIFHMFHVRNEKKCDSSFTVEVVDLIGTIVEIFYMGNCIYMFLAASSEEKWNENLRVSNENHLIIRKHFFKRKMNIFSMNTTEVLIICRLHHIL